jgi:endonuclease/exonuclease/phosphatase family metal-dependent hydrolase
MRSVFFRWGRAGAALGLALSAHAFSVLNWNVNGNGAPDWSTNAAQVRAIGRIVRHLDADLITLQEIPQDQSAQVVEFVRAFLPGYHWATNSGTDGHIRSVILSRYPIRRSQSWLDGAPLAPFGYDGAFTRDLFEAEIEVPGFRAPVHVFTTHLKNGSDLRSATRRGAEAGAISNFFVHLFLPAHPDALYLLTGDLNEDVARPGQNSHDAIPRLANNATGLRLTRPVNPLTGSERTWSSRMDFLVVRYDYILPSTTLYARLARSEVFQSSRLDPPPPPLRPGDDALASDHLPVLMVFRGADPGPFALAWQPGDAGRWRLVWPGWPGYTYQVLRGDDLVHWRIAATLAPNGGHALSWPVPADKPARFFRVRRIP